MGVAAWCFELELGILRTMTRGLPRSMQLLLTLIVLSGAVFLAISIVPGDQLASVIQAEGRGVLPASERARLIEEFGLDQPWLIRFARWLGQVASGDLGTSWQSGRPVWSELAKRLPRTLELNLFAMLLLLTVGLPLGWLAAARERSLLDRGLLLLLFALFALPAFWVALLLQEWLAVRWNWLPLYGRSGETWRELVLPASCQALHAIAFVAAFARQSARLMLRSHAHRMGRAGGIKPLRLFYTTAIRGSLLPLISLVGLLIPGLVSGSVLIEQIFQWPGVGRYFVDALLARDVPVVLGVALLSGVATLCGSWFADRAGVRADPRLGPGAGSLREVR